jgi:hypothetical protein
MLAGIEGGRGLWEILFGKRLKTERYRQICEMKNVLRDMFAALAPLKERLNVCEKAVSKAEDELRSRQDKADAVQKAIDDLRQEVVSLERDLETEARKTEAIKKARGEAEAEYRARLAEAKTGMKMSVLDKDFWGKFAATDNEASTNAQLTNPWITDEYNRAREKLFYLALRLHKDFVLSSKACRNNFINLGMLWKYRKGKAYKSASEELCRFSDRDKNHAFPHLLNTLFLLTPVLSTTFASVGRFLNHVREPGSLGTLIIDEAGQASPHMALGALWRCRRAIVVGDPKQVEPVVTGDVSVIKRAVSKNNEMLNAYRRDTLSVQEFADRINRFGAMLPGGRGGGTGGGETWVGCPLVVHRRCIEPMFGISNRLS